PLVAVRGAHLLEPLLSAKAAIGISRIEQPADVLTVDFGPLALPVRSMRPSDIGALIPRETEPAPGFQNGLLGLPSRTRLIRILDTKNEPAPLLPGKNVVEKSLVGRPDMGISC